jgi:hypothetical protein
VLKYCRGTSATPNQQASQIADLLIRHCPMLEQLCFHAHDDDELAQLVIGAVGARIELHHSETRMHEDW